MIKYKFRANASHRMLVLNFRKNRASSEGEIARIFAMNLKLNPKGNFESLRYRELSFDLDPIAAGTYYSPYEFWCYPKFMKLEDGTPPPRDFVKMAQDILNILEVPYIPVRGTFAQGLALANNMTDNAQATMTDGEASALFADQPEWTME